MTRLSANPLGRLNLLRLLAAGLLVFTTIVMVGVGLLTWIPGLPPLIVGIAAASSGLALGGLAVRVLNPQGADLLGMKTLEEQVAELQAAGLLTATSFQATRTFQVEEFEDEGSHYFIELSDRSVLFLSGQYLYDYEPDVTGERVFPSSAFTIRRHKVEGFAADIQIAGAPLEPELIAPPFTETDYCDSVFPGDGAIIRDRTYDELKNQFANRRA